MKIRGIHYDKYPQTLKLSKYDFLRLLNFQYVFFAALKTRELSWSR